MWPSSASTPSRCSTPGRSGARPHSDRLVPLPRRHLARWQEAGLHLLSRLRQRPQRRHRINRTASFSGMKGVLSMLDVPTLRTRIHDCRRARQITALIDQRGGLARVVTRCPHGCRASRRRKSNMSCLSQKRTTPTTRSSIVIPGANDDPGLLRWGLRQTIRRNRAADARECRRDGQPQRAGAAVLVSDNFYMEPEASGVGIAGWWVCSPTTSCR